MVNQENDLGRCLHSKSQITAMFTYLDISADGYYVALDASNVRYLTFNKHLRDHRINNLRILLINNNISENANYAPYKYQ